jgi:hypothetical protein
VTPTAQLTALKTHQRSNQVLVQVHRWLQVAQWVLFNAATELLPQCHPQHYTCVVAKAEHVATANEAMFLPKSCSAHRDSAATAKAGLLWH